MSLRLPHRPALRLALGVASLGVALVGALPAGAAPAERARPGDPVPGRYIVLLKSGVAPGDFARGEGDRPSAVLRRAANGYVAELSPGRLNALLRRKASGDMVLDVVPDQVVAVDGVLAPAPWGLDRIDQRTLPLDGAYGYGSDGAGVTAYVVDTGIEAGHPAFGGRVAAGFSVYADGTGDCNGHGTHVAGTLGGAGYGVAPAVRLVPVRTMDCAGSGTLSGVLAGIEWMIDDHQPGAPAVANLSLGTSASLLLDRAVENAVADGIVTVVAAGNAGADACTASPARAPGAVTVGAVARGDARAGFSNWGTCLDLFAPGDGILSAWTGGATMLASGTSMAAPHVAGAAARLMTGAAAPAVDQVVAALLADATTGVVVDAGAGSPNRLLHATPPARGSTPPPDGSSQDGLAAPDRGATGGAGSAPASPRVVAARHRGDWILIRLRGPAGARYEVFRDGRLLLVTSRTRLLVRHGVDRVDRIRVRTVTASGISDWSNAVVRRGTALRVLQR